MKITLITTAVLALLAAVVSASEVTEPFTPGACVNEYTRQFWLDVPTGWKVLMVGIEVQAPKYEHGVKQPELLIELQRRTPLANESGEGEHKSEWDTSLRYKNFQLGRSILSTNEQSVSITISPSTSVIISASPSPTPSPTPSTSGGAGNMSSSSGGYFEGDTFGEWVVADNTYECPVAATRFKCVKNFYMKSIKGTKTDQFRIVVTNTNDNNTSPVCMVFHPIPLGPFGQYEQYIAAAIFIIVFVILAFEMVSRALVTMLGDVVLFALLWGCQAQPTLEEVMSWLDWRTMVLLTSMMMAVAIFAETGFFEWSAWQVLKISRKKLSRLSLTTRKWIILLAMGMMTFAASAFLDNCTTVLLFAPVTVRMAQLLDADPMPLLMTMIYFCTLGGATTYVGDPPNLIIGGQFELGFNPFIINCLPPILIVLPFGIGMMWLQFRTRMKATVKHTGDMTSSTPDPHGGHGGHEGHEGHASINNSDGPQGTTNEHDETSSTSASPTTDIPLVERTPASDEEAPHDKTPEELEEEAKKKELELDAEYRIRDKKTFWKCVVMLGLMLVFFLLESVTMVSTTWVAVVGAGILLLITSPRQIAPILEKIEWPTLFFFAYLFIFVKLIEKLGVIYWISEYLVKIIEACPMEARLPVAMMAVLWMSALLACWCNNIAFTASIIPLIYFIANKPGLGVPLRPLAWTLALGVAMSANATVIAAAPNLIVAQIAGRAGYKISFIRFLVWGFPFMLVTTSIIAVYLLLVYWLAAYQG